MADSNITKRALAGTLKELMKETSFEKINVAQIAERCGMNRKSFYYHFRDKYDLVNWIFDIEVYTLTQRHGMERWAFLEVVCEYLYENKRFYRKVLRYRGQNSFQEHFREVLHPLLYAQLKEVIEKDSVHPICINFFADGITCAIERWLLENDDIPPKEFSRTLRSMIQIIAANYKPRPEDSECNIPM